MLRKALLFSALFALAVAFPIPDFLPDVQPASSNFEYEATEATEVTTEEPPENTKEFDVVPDGPFPASSLEGEASDIIGNEANVLLGVAPITLLPAIV